MERVIKVGAEVVGTPPNARRSGRLTPPMNSVSPVRTALRLRRVLPEIEELLAICTQSARFCDCVFASDRNYSDHGPYQLSQIGIKTALLAYRHEAAVTRANLFLQFLGR